MRTYSVAVFAIAHSLEREEVLQEKLTRVLQAFRQEGFAVSGFNVKLWTGKKEREDD